MLLNRLRIPLWLPITIILLLILGFAAEPFILANTTEDQLARNVLLSALPFILVFIAIILTFITVIVVIARQLNNNITRRQYRPVEMALIGGIGLGIFGMFQPWIFGLFKAGFLVLLISTLGFILWSHITPKAVSHDE
jgi:uncharacterized membrane protein YidH (DUF202 family)